MGPTLYGALGSCSAGTRRDRAAYRSYPWSVAIVLPRTGKSSSTTAMLASETETADIP
jgi:hypothetical protein